MFDPRPETLPRDMLNAVKEVEEFMKGLSFEDFCNDTKVTRAVTMDFIIIGEAAKHVSAEVRKCCSDIPGPKSWG